MPVISFASSKGGAGKTTSAIVLGTEIAQNTTVAFIDADPAHRVIDWWQREPTLSNITVAACTDPREIGSAISEAQKRATVVIVDLEGIASRLNTAVIARSNLVIIPMGDEQQDATAAVETLREIKADEETLGRAIPARILFARTKAAVKSSIAKKVNQEMREHVPCFETELKDRSAYSHLHNTGGGLRDLPDGVGRLEKAIGNAQDFAAEVFAVLKDSVKQKEAV